MVHAVVVGAGVGGLGTAVRLAARGHRVTLLEKNERVGGKLNRLEASGFRFDTGPHLIALPGIIGDTFRAAGRRVEDYLTLLPVEPLCRYFYPDGSRLDISSNLPRLVQEVGGIAPEEVTHLFRYLAHARALFERAGPVFLMRERPRLRDFFSRRALDVLRIEAHNSLHRVNKRFFKDERLVQLFDRYATYNGSSPFKAPGTLAMISYIEIAGGGWYIQGGLYRLAEALSQVARELGVDIRTGAEASEILVEPRSGWRGPRAVGVRLRGGGTVMADALVLNADPMYAYPALVPEEFRSEALMLRMDALEPSCSGFVLLLGVKGSYPDLAHHNIFFNRDYEDEFKAIFERMEPPADPTVYVVDSTRTDHSQAPPGHSALFVLVNVPALTPEADWDAWKSSYRDTVLSALEERGLTDLRERIVFEEALTPADFERKYNSWRGSLYGIASNSRVTAFLRPPNRAPGLPNLYFVGGSVHPGGGIPLVLLSARLVARLVR